MAKWTDLSCQAELRPWLPFHSPVTLPSWQRGWVDWLRSLLNHMQSCCGRWHIQATVFLEISGPKIWAFDLEFNMQQSSNYYMLFSIFFKLSMNFITAKLLVLSLFLLKRSRNWKYLNLFMYSLPGMRSKLSVFWVSTIISSHKANRFSKLYLVSVFPDRHLPSYTLVECA